MKTTELRSRYLTSTFLKSNPIEALRPTVGNQQDIIHLPDCRQILTLNGINQYIDCPRIDDVEIPNPAFELEGYFDLTTGGSLWSQNDDPFSFFSSFHVDINFGSPTVNITLRGSSTSFSIPEIERGFGLWALKIAAGNYTFRKDGNVLSSGAASEGTATEPSATFKIGAEGLSGGASNYITGETRDHKLWINGDRDTGTLHRHYPLDDGFANDPTARELVSGADGVVVNATGGSWGDSCL
jgi:hypothetical protein